MKELGENITEVNLEKRIIIVEAVKKKKKKRSRKKDILRFYNIISKYDPMYND